MSNNAEIRFEVREGVSGTNRDDWSVRAVYETGKEAADAKGAMTAADGCVLAVVRVVGEPEGDPNWREREAGRFESGRYKPVPWSEDFAGYVDHWAHIAESDNRKIAFTEDEAKGRKDVQKVLSVGDYLRRFFTSYAGGCSCCESDRYMKPDTIQSFIDSIEGLSTEVYYASTAEEIQAVYEESGGTDCEASSCGSCMGYHASQFSTHGIHPTTVYAAGDLQVAYLRSNEGRLMARGLVWPAKLVAGRLYGNSATALRIALRAAGYTDFEHDSLIGANLLKIPVAGHSDRYVMPYIDGTQKFVAAGNYFEIADSSYPHAFDGGSTDGTAYIVDPLTCERCEEETHPNNIMNVGGSDWCRNCADEEASLCVQCHEYHETEDMTLAHRWTDESLELVCTSCLDHRFTQLDDGAYHRTENTQACIDCEEIHVRIEMAMSRCLPCAQNIELNSADEQESVAPAFLNNAEVINGTYGPYYWTGRDTFDAFGTRVYFIDYAGERYQYEGATSRWLPVPITPESDQSNAFDVVSLRHPSFA